MKNALISPNESPIQYISGWTTDVPHQPIYMPINNSCRVAQVSDTTFEISLPLFWAECADDVVADRWYYNTQNNEIFIIPNEPYPS